MIRSFLASIAFLIVVCVPLSLNAQSQRPLTWAVLGDSSVIESGFTDLLTVKLDEAGFQLVERTQLSGLEQELQRSLESGAISESMSIGRRIGAHRLIVCQHTSDSTRPKDGPTGLRVFICDCDVSARIAVADFDLSQNATVVDKVVSWLKSHTNLPKIKQVIGLAPFACKNLGDAFQDIGKQAHHFLSTQILAIPGVALMEWEEARTLNQEFDVTAAAEKRMVPSLIAVDYQVIPNSQDAPPLVEVSLSVQSKGQPIIESAKLSLLELEPWLRTRILSVLLQDKTSLSGLSQEEQISFLKSRAQALFRLGTALSCAQVREVILQIDPTDAEERRRILSDYSQCAGTSTRNRGSDLYPLTTLEIQARSFQREHFEYLVRNKQISYAEAIERFPKLVIDVSGGTAFSRMTPKYSLSEVDLERTLASLEQDFQFVRNVGPAILKMKNSSKTPDATDLKQRVAWSKAVLSVAQLDLSFHWGAEESRIRTIQLITDIIPQEYPTIDLGQWLFSTTTFPKAMLQTFDPRTRALKRHEVGNWPQNLLELYQKHDHSGHRHVRLYLRLERFNQLHASPMNLHTPFTTNTLESTVSIAELVSEVQQIREDAKQTVGAEQKGLTAPHQAHFDYVYDTTDRYARELQRRIANNPPPSYPDLPRPNPDLGRLKFQALNLQVPALAYHSIVWQRDGSDHDLVYDHSNVYRLNRNGVFTKVSPEEDYTFIDDELVWLLKRKQPGEVLVSATNRQGQNVIRSESLTLPPFDDFTAIGIGGGKGLVVGWFDGGTWCGLLERAKQGLSFRVIHEAREYNPSPIAKEAKLAAQSAGLRFSPTWHARGSDANGNCLILGRYGMTPIRIDLQTWNVNVLPLENSHFMQDAKIHNQHLYQSVYSFAFEFDLNNKSSSIARKMVIGMDHMQQVEQGHATAGNHAGTLLVDGDWIVYPGATWYRYNALTKETERLVKTTLPHPYLHARPGQSSIHGFILLHSESDKPYRVYQVNIQPDPSINTK